MIQSRAIPGSAVAAMFVLHLAALVFGLIGLLIMLPNPELWTGDPNAVRVFDYSMRYAGSVHIIFGALTMLLFGIRALGWRPTLIFAGVTYVLSLGSELIGTSTGWPFGTYAYTDFLGWKVLGHVPYTIPLSWFYMGFASYLLGSLVAERLGRERSLLWTCLLGTWFLTVWDLVLDPAMAHSSLRVQFWTWNTTGPYFEMPLRNLIGWSLTGFVFMAISRALWRRQPKVDGVGGLPLAVYAANLGFAIVVSASVDLWIPVLLALALGLLPGAVIVLRNRRVPSRLAAATPGD